LNIFKIYFDVDVQYELNFFQSQSSFDRVIVNKPIEFSEESVQLCNPLLTSTPSIMHRRKERGMRRSKIENEIFRPIDI